MTLIKDGLNYETPQPKTSKAAYKQERINQLDRLSTSYITWYLVRRHKTAIIASYALIMTMYVLEIPQTIARFM